MENPLYDQIIRSRRLLENPYAYLDCSGGYSAVPKAPTPAKPHPDIVKSRRRLEDPYAHLDGEGGFSAEGISSDAVVEIKRDLPEHAAGKFSLLVRNKLNKRRHSVRSIEAIARDIHTKMWRDQDDIWLDHVPANPIDMLDPALALHLIGYDFALDETLGQYYNGGKQVEVAGTIDDATRRVRISRQFAPEIRNFTTAHELGHALLHDARGLHRDRPLDGSTMSRELIEIEADRFASYFLMPERLVRACFNRHFGTDRFSLDDGTQFALSRGTGLDLAKCRTLRDLSRVLAHAESYNGERFQSLAGQFKVSVEAMAIRLEELGLVVPPGA